MNSRPEENKACLCQLVNVGLLVQILSLIACRCLCSEAKNNDVGCKRDTGIKENWQHVREIRVRKIKQNTAQQHNIKVETKI
jgi:hypothetical protein